MSCRTSGDEIFLVDSSASTNARRDRVFAPHGVGAKVSGDLQRVLPVRALDGRRRPGDQRRVECDADADDNDEESPKTSAALSHYPLVSLRIRMTLPDSSAGAPTAADDKPQRSFLADAFASCVPAADAVTCGAARTWGRGSAGR